MEGEREGECGNKEVIDGYVRVPSKQVSSGSVRVNINELWGWSMPGEE